MDLSWGNPESPFPITPGMARMSRPVKEKKIGMAIDAQKKLESFSSSPSLPMPQRDYIRQSHYQMEFSSIK
jgi:hypothetical protein